MCIYSLEREREREITCITTTRGDDERVERERERERFWDRESFATTTRKRVEREYSRLYYAMNE
jgi:hypothetical protein